MTASGNRPARGEPSSAENPWPVRTVATKVAGWIDRLGSVWVEGEITQINARPGTRTAFIVLRDPAADMSLSVTCTPALIENSPVRLVEGARVIMYGKLTFFTGRGTISLRALEIRAVGIGELLARIERLRSLLDAEGLFDARLKRPLPFLPQTIGLITARASAAERDIIEVAGRRWPAVEFAIRHTPVQGPTAVPAIVKALGDLNDDPAVDVIVLARGGGSVEDLLPFSDELLCRAISSATTPVVSAIGHEPDRPLSDYVADFRAATPTDAAKHVVPDATAELEGVRELKARAAAALRNWVHREQRTVDSLRQRPVLADPMTMVTTRGDDIAEMVRVLRRDVTRGIEQQSTTIVNQRARLTALGPAATMARGYAVVQRVVPGADPEVVRSVEDTPPGTQLRVRVGDGALTAAVMGRAPS